MLERVGIGSIPVGVGVAVRVGIMDPVSVGEGDPVAVVVEVGVEVGCDAARASLTDKEVKIIQLSTTRSNATIQFKNQPDLGLKQVNREVSKKRLGRTNERVILSN